MTADDALNSKQPLTWQLVVEFSPSVEPGNELQVAERVTEATRGLGLRPVQMERVRQAIVEALCYAMAQRHQGQRNPALSIRIWVAGTYAQGRSRSGPDAAQGGQQKHPGWGFFLVQKHDNDPQTADLASRHAIELFLYREGGLATKQANVKSLDDSRELPPTDRQGQRE